MCVLTKCWQLTEPELMLMVGKTGQCSQLTKSLICAEDDFEQIHTYIESKINLETFVIKADFCMVLCGI